jgi:uncharacterized membrane protein YgcG
MPIFSIKRALTPPEGRSSGESFLRFMLLILVFAGSGFLYVKHFDRAIETIKSRQSIYDETGRLTDAQVDVFQEFGRLMRGEFGLEVIVRVDDEPVYVPELDSRTLYFGIDTAGQSVTIEFPPLVGNALGKEFIRELREDHFPPYFEQGNWPKGLAEAMRKIWDKLSAINTEGET